MLLGDCEEHTIPEWWRQKYHWIGTNAVWNVWQVWPDKVNIQTGFEMADKDHWPRYLGDIMAPEICSFREITTLTANALLDLGHPIDMDSPHIHDLTYKGYAKPVADGVLRCGNH